MLFQSLGRFILYRLCFYSILDFHIFSPLYMLGIDVRYRCINEKSYGLCFSELSDRVKLYTLPYNGVVLGNNFPLQPPVDTLGAVIVAWSKFG